VQEHTNQFKQSVKIANDEHIKTSNYFLSNGLDSFKQNINNYMKKFSKNVFDLILQYYREKKDVVKKKQRKLLVGQTQHIRYYMKHAFYSLITSNDYQKTIKKLKESYSILKMGAASGNIGAS
jgi:methyltransferase-like protein